MQKSNKFILLQLLFALAALVSCQRETIQDKAEQDAREYTRRYCPTPPINNISTDSVTYDRRKNLYTYHCTFTDVLDNQDVIDENQDLIRDVLRKSITESTSMKGYVEAGFHFQYICHSKENPDVILFQVTF